MTTPQDSPNPRVLLTFRETRDTLGVSDSLLRRLTAEDLVPHVRLGRRVLYPRARILALADDPAALATGGR